MKKVLGQREAMRQFLIEYGYNRNRVCDAYAAGDRRGEIERKSDKNDMSPDAYADEVWRDGHRPRNPWIVKFCKQHGIKV
jgi:hypothetical protein